MLQHPHQRCGGQRETRHRGGVGAVMLKARESNKTLSGFGVTYRITRCTWLLFGVIPLAWSKEVLRR